MEHQDISSQKLRNREIPKGEIVTWIGCLATGFRDMKNRKRPKCEMTKMIGANTDKLHFRVSGTATWSVKKLYHSNVEIPKCRNAN
jgi:hypothetical protein